MISASMGIYVFNREVLLAALTCGERIIDFANDVIPSLIGSCDVRAYHHEDRIKKMPLYWRDVGTPEAYYASSMDCLNPIRPSILTTATGRYVRPIAPNPTEKGRFSKWDDPEINSIIPNGADIGSASVYRSVLFPGVVLELEPMCGTPY